MKYHYYSVDLHWTGNAGTGTSGYRDYARSHVLSVAGKQSIDGSSDPAFRGDRARWSPEDLLVASVSACHQLWYLHLCSAAGIVVTDYEDTAEGTMTEENGGEGQFVSITLRPRVTIAQSSDADLAKSLHHDANAKCFIARSLKFPVHHEPLIIKSTEA